MDKLKYVKIENEDGSLSDNIPLGVDAENVDISSNNFKNLLDYINENDNQIDNLKNSNISLSNQIKSLSSGSPKGTYASVEALETANPETGVYVVTENGHIYSWTKDAENAIDLGVYQATGVSDKEITVKKLSDSLRDSLNLSIPNFSLQNGYYNIYGIFTENDNYNYTTPIKLLKNQTIFARVRANNTIAVFAQCDENGNNVKSLVNGKDNILLDYQYTAKEECYIIVSGVNISLDTFLVYIKNTLNITNLDSFSLLPLNISIPIITNNDGYIDTNGDTQNNTNYYYTSPILLLPDETIFVRCLANSSVSVISSTQINLIAGVKTSQIVGSDDVNNYQFTTKNSCYVIISYDKSVEPIIIKSKENTNSFTDFSLNEGFINIYGIIDNNNNFNYTSPIKLLKNQTIKATLRAYDTISVFTKCDENGENLVPQVLGIGNLLHDYEYTATEDCYIIVSGAKDTFIVYIKDIDDIIIKNINDIEENINDIEENINDIINILNGKKVPLLSIFETIGLIGDSHTAGAIEGTGSKDCKNLSTMAQVCKQCGNTPKFYARSGESCKSWLDYNYNVEECKAYIIALGSNDRSNQYPLGTSLDINTDNETFYGYYSKIISKIKTIAPNAKIFLFSLYGNDTDPASIPYNDAIKYFADNTENCFFVDMRNSYTIYQDYKIGGHMSAIGYTFIADYVINQTNDLIISNYDKFNNVGIY